MHSLSPQPPQSLFYLDSILKKASVSTKDHVVNTVVHRGAVLAPSAFASKSSGGAFFEEQHFCEEPGWSQPRGAAVAEGQGTRDISSPI